MTKALNVHNFKVAFSPKRTKAALAAVLEDLCQFESFEDLESEFVPSVTVGERNHYLGEFA